MIEPDGASTNRQVISHCAALLAVSLLPTLLGFAGAIYFAAAFVLGIGFLASGIGLAMESTTGCPPAAVCLVDLFAGFALDDGAGSCSAMSEIVLIKTAERTQLKNRRLGLILALLTLLYIAAVIAFIIIY